MTHLVGAKVEWVDGKMVEVAGSEFTIPADLVLLAMGFVSPVQKVLDAFGVEKDARGNAKAELKVQKATNLTKQKCLQRPICVADNLWLCGKYVKVVNVHALLMSF